MENHARKLSGHRHFPCAFCTEACLMERLYSGKMGQKTRKMQDDSYTRTESYTLSFTRNPQCIKGLSRVGVGNVGDFSKTFFREERRSGFL